MIENSRDGTDGVLRVFPRHGKRVAADDRRVRVVRRLDMTYEMPVYSSRQAWQERASALRRHVLVSTGLWPLPERTPLNPSIVGRVERDGYSVEKVSFESYPGFLVTGNLFRPRGRAGPYPAVLNPHGHWDRGRLQHDEECSPQARAATLARQGYVAFLYDMVGYVDSIQVPHTFGDPLYDLWGLNLMGLQLWNSLRAVDFLAALPDVDPARLGCTGASGGGTQTFMLTAIDERIAVSAPVNMVSAHMQGGCLCENAPTLRVETTNVELAALMAPRPMLLVSATGDWTHAVPTLEYPAIREIYRLYGAGDRVASVQIDAGHNYNRASREAVYAFFGRWLLQAPDGTDLREQSLTPEREADLRVFADLAHPPGTLGADALADQRIAAAREAIDRHWPRDVHALAGFRAVFIPALSAVLVARWPDEVAAETLGVATHDAAVVERLLLGRPGVGDQLPALLFRPPGWAGGDAVLAIHAGGKGELLDHDGRQPGALVAGLLARGRAVLAPDVFLTGEYHAPAGRAGRDHGRAFFTTYNATDTAVRVQDILTALAYLRTRARSGAVELVGLGEAGLWCLLARPLAPGELRVVADVAGFDPDDDASYLERLYVPGLRRAGGVETALALSAPAPTWVHNAAGAFRVPAAAALYAALSRGSALAIDDRRASEAAIAAWITHDGAVPHADGREGRENVG